jgi:hypothetical protein
VKNVPYLIRVLVPHVVIAFPETENHKIGVASDRLLIKPNFMKMWHLFQNSVGGYPHRQHGDLISLHFFQKKNRPRGKTRPHTETP